MAYRSYNEATADRLRIVLPVIRDVVQTLLQRDPCSAAMHAEIYDGVHLLRMAVPHLERAIERATS